ncbi:adenosylcobalamin-dependent ribonucleoside-diphosphate reductase, partial [Tepidanaerobacter sp. EBM-49]
IGFISTAKNDRLEVIDNRALEFNDIIPNQQQVFAKIYDGPGKGCGPGRMALGANRELYRDIQHYLPNVAAPRNLNRSRLSYLAEKYPEVAESQLKWFLENNQFYDRVETVEDDEAFTLDLSVPDNNTYIAAGFISHNTRRGANMGILRVDHPDILDFIRCKEDDKEITNFNISVAITDKFMEALKNDETYDLVDPHTKKVAGKLKAREVFDLIVDMAWKNGEPGIIFIDRMNKYNPTPEVGEIESTNPCGEQPLLPFESCNLGSINLVKFVKKSGEKIEIDYEDLKDTVHKAVRFLDDVIDVNVYPLKEIEEMTLSNRKIGLGVMGFADMLIALGIPYNSDEALKIAEEIMSFIDKESKNASCELAKERGVFPNWDKSIYKEKGVKLRNATTTTIAPTGTISIIAGVSSGIEPVFALAFERHVLDNQRLVEIHPMLEQVLKERGLYSEELMEKILERGTLQGIEEVPEDIKRVFVTAHDISPEWHVKMQAAFQKYTDNAVSKTVNFPQNATREDVKKVYLLAYELDCKGVTIYRDRSREEQVLNKGAKIEKKVKEETTESQEEANMDDKIKPRPRPNVTYGSTEKVKIGCGNLYITVNSDENGICEVFTNLGRAGGCPSQSEATSRLISLALRAGIDVKAIVEQLKGIRCHSTLRQMATNKDIKVLSCPDAIGRALERSMGKTIVVNGNSDVNEADIKRYVDINNEELEKANKKKPNPGKNNSNGALCPECGHKLEHEGGCVVCRSCGYSKCS